MELLGAQLKPKHTYSFLPFNDEGLAILCPLADIPVGTTIPTPSPEPRDDPPSCYSCSDASQMDPSDKVATS